MSATKGGEKKAMSKKVKAKLEGGQREGTRKREKEGRKEPHGSAWQRVSREHAGVPLAGGSPPGKAARQCLDAASSPFTGQEAQSEHSQPPPSSQSDWFPGRWGGILARSAGSGQTARLHRWLVWSPGKLSTSEPQDPPPTRAHSMGPR